MKAVWKAGFSKLKDDADEDKHTFFMRSFYRVKQSLLSFIQSKSTLDLCRATVYVL